MDCLAYLIIRHRHNFSDRFIITLHGTPEIICGTMRYERGKNQSERGRTGRAPGRRSGCILGSGILCTTEAQSTEHGFFRTAVFALSSIHFTSTVGQLQRQLVAQKFVPQILIRHVQDLFQGGLEHLFSHVINQSIRCGIGRSGDQGCAIFPFLVQIFVHFQSCSGTNIDLDNSEG